MSPPEPKLLIYDYGGQRKIGPIDKSYQSTIALCQKMFPDLLSPTNVSFYTKDLPICNGRQAEIYPGSWQDVVGQIGEVVIIDQGLSAATQDGSNSVSLRNQGTIFVRGLTGKTTSLIVDLTCSVAHLKARIQTGNLDLIFGGRLLEDNLTLNQSGVQDGATLSLQRQVIPPPVTSQMFRKPVIYLLAPVSVEASVELSLVPHWSLSAIYPVTPIKSGPAGTGQCVSWKVRVHPEGHLTELSTGLDIAYLYWEALTNTPLPHSPPASPLLGPAMLESGDKVQAFDPTNANLNDENAVVVSVNEVTRYLDAALKTLGLHIEARTSFITYWLPSLLEHEHIAFRFLPQASYEQAAPLSISPTPDIVTRIFMVFKGIEESELEAWPAAQKRVKADVSSWIDIVGVDVRRTVDKGLFRVIEWGGMEISRTQHPL